MNTAELAALCQRVRNDERSLEIQVCCPRGHFIVALAVTESVPGSPIQPLYMWVAAGRDHHLRVRRVPITDPQPDLTNPGFTMTETPRGPAVAVSCRRCPRWKPVRDYQELAAELAVYALAGQRKHRLR